MAQVKTVYPRLNQKQLVRTGHLPKSSRWTDYWQEKQRPAPVPVNPKEARAKAAKANSNQLD